MGDGVGEGVMGERVEEGGMGGVGVEGWRVVEGVGEERGEKLWV